MKIVAIADTHLNHANVVIPDGDVPIHGGDLTRHGTLEELAVTAGWLRGLPFRHKLVIAGNHDLALEREPEAARRLLHGLTYLQDASCTIDGVRFYGTPWQPDWQSMAFNLPRGEPLASVWRHIPATTDVLIVHGPPRGYGDRLLDGTSTGCADLLARIRVVRPRLVLCGHMHEDGGIWHDGATVVANVNCDAGRRGATVFELDADRVVPVEVPPSGRAESRRRDDAAMI